MIAVNLLTLLIVLILSALTNAINVNWLPDDANAPLPLSSSFRQKLRSLCKKQADGDRALSSSIIGRKTVVLTEMCKKLKRDDDNIAGAEEDDKKAIRQVGFYMLIMMAITWKLIQTQQFQDMKYRVRYWYRNICEKISTRLNGSSNSSSIKSTSRSGSSSQTMASAIAANFGSRADNRDRNGNASGNGGDSTEAEALRVKEARLRRFHMGTAETDKAK